jgi:magnesium-transporting ATPase (P-type)
VSETAKEFLAVFAHGLSAKNKTIEALLPVCAKRDDWEVIDEIPFKSINKFSVVRARTRAERRNSSGAASEASGTYDFVFGAAECIAPRFASSSMYAEIKEKICAYENEGMRTLVFAVRALPESPYAANDTLSEDSLGGLVPQALVVFSEALKEEARDILAHFAERGVRQVLISGDSLDTVQCIAKKISLPGAERGMSGSELSLLSKTADAAERGEQELHRRILACNVFARVLPEQKQTIIRAFRNAGHHVAMVGDGVNDVLALKESELSIAMGSGGSMVKDVSDIVLVNNRFDILPGLLAEGEHIISRIRDCARICTLKNSYAVFLILASLTLGITFPFFPQQITMINFVTITLPLLYIIKFSFGKARVESGFIGDILKFSLAIACLIAGTSFILNYTASAAHPNLPLQEAAGMTWLIGRFMENPSHYVQTLSIVPIILMASIVFLALAYSSSGASSPRRGKGFWQRAFPLLVSVSVCSVFFASLYIPDVAGFFEFTPLCGEDYLEIARVLVPAIILECLLLRFFLRKKRRP